MIIFFAVVRTARDADGFLEVSNQFKKEFPPGSCKANDLNASWVSVQVEERIADEKRGIIEHVIQRETETLSEKSQERELSDIFIGENWEFGNQRFRLTHAVI